jgi:hypothetical protein
LVVLYAKARPDQCQDILDLLKHPVESYSQANEWQRSRIRLPQVTLDELTLYPLQLDVTVKGFGKLLFCPSKASLQQVCWDYDKALKQFMSLALALCYKASMMIHHAVVDKKVLPKNYSDVERKFPLYSSVQTMQMSLQQVSQNIESTFQLHQLHGALKIANDHGDTKAAAKIRASKLEELEEDVLHVPTMQRMAWTKWSSEIVFDVVW